MKFIKILSVLVILIGGLFITVFSIPQTNILIKYYLLNSKVNLSNTRILPTEYTFNPSGVNEGIAAIQNDCIQIKLNNSVSKTNNTKTSKLYTLDNDQNIILTNYGKSVFEITKSVLAESKSYQPISNKEFVKKLFNTTPSNIQLFISADAISENFTLLLAKKNTILEANDVKTTSFNGTDFYVFKEFGNREYTSIVAANNNKTCDITIIDKKNDSADTVNTIIKSAKIL